MKTLWFKREFVAPILAGEKTDTFRVLGKRTFAVGELVALSNGPRPAFARALITAVELVAADDQAARQSLVAQWSAAGTQTRLAFRLV
ncbi:MAG: ASCH domain-containing protein [Pseudomonadota bacterium]|nr:ASCH domain-containing protein [Pseudomonadota bacterium]